MNNVLQEILAPIRKRREELQKEIPEVYKILYEGSKKARKVASETVNKVKTAIGINYFEDTELINCQIEKFQKNK